MPEVKVEVLPSLPWMLTELGSQTTGGQQDRNGISWELGSSLAVQECLVLATNNEGIDVEGVQVSRVVLR